MILEVDDSGPLIVSSQRLPARRDAKKIIGV